MNKEYQLSKKAVYFPLASELAVEDCMCSRVIGMVFLSFAPSSPVYVYYGNYYLGSCSILCDSDNCFRVVTFCKGGEVIEKYKIANDIAVVALMYKQETGQVTLGGNNRLRGLMVAILEDTFGNPRCKVKQMQVNKMRFIFKKSQKDFDECVRLLRENHYVVEPVTELGNIMR